MTSSLPSNYIKFHFLPSLSPIKVAAAKSGVVLKSVFDAVYERIGKIKPIKGRGN